ncbi:MAG: uracil-DNA glycosylase [Tissierellia bacterium]|nr:uracil-DNA glycosylase [Tissierellia bacterium]
MIEIGNKWDKVLEGEWSKPYYKELRKLLYLEYQNHEIYPDMYDIFNAIKYVDYDDVKVVILGQDPYHGPGQAHGFSFSVKPGIKTPPSLLNIYKELESDLGCYIPDNGHLIKWANQGVLLLNTVLTVRRGQANSHSRIGWTILTDRIIRELNNREKPMVFILWGRNAYAKKEFLDNEAHLILTSAHPSPLSARRGFFGSAPFSKTNEFLTQNGLDPIDWQIENLEFQNESI